MYIGFDDDVEGFVVLELCPRVEFFGRKFGVAFAFLDLSREFFGDFFVFGDEERLAGIGNIRKARNFDGGRRFGDFDRDAALVGHALDFAVAGAANEDIIDAERTFLNEDGCDSTAAIVLVGFEDESACGFVGIGLEFEDFGLELDELEEFIDTRASLGRNFFEDGL